MSSEAQVKAVAGLRGHGKSSHVVQMTRDVPRVLYYDSLGDDYAQGIVCRDLAVLESFWRRTYQHRFRISYKPVDPMADLPRICELAYECGDMTLVIDEIHLYFRGAFCPTELTKIITAGRHAGVELIGVTQAPRKLGELLRSQAAVWDIFAIREPAHAKYLAERCVGVDISQILSLRKYEYLHFEDGAECYWRCTDDLDSGQTRNEALPYETDAPTPATTSDSCDDAPAGRTVGSPPADGNSPLPSA
ncbi:MAG TPA: ATP-binding protein [Halothiobacillaceae bacterium]|nr:ATP-binding protein [Halothiobacillaceae bacterium]